MRLADVTHRRSSDSSSGSLCMSGLVPDLPFPMLELRSSRRPRGTSPGLLLAQKSSCARGESMCSSRHTNEDKNMREQAAPQHVVGVIFLSLLSLSGF